MGERTEHAPGMPSWVDVSTTDTGAAAGFYGALLGWTAEMVPDPAAGGYGMFTLGGKYVAGLGPVQGPNQPPSWMVYMTVADAAATLEAVTAAGGTVAMGPMQVFDSGTMGVARDSLGTYFAVWQPGAHIGAQLVNVPGSFAWSELATADLAKSRDFYQAVFGWGVEESRSSDQAAIFTIGGRVICGAHPASPQEFPAWLVWFSVEDCDAATAQVGELGGTILMPANDMPNGRASVVADAQGAVFGIVGLTNPDD